MNDPPIALPETKSDSQRLLREMNEALLVSAVRQHEVAEQLEQQILECVATEQRRIGHDLHDEVGQELTGLSLLAANLHDSLSEQSSADAGAALKVLDGLKRTLRLVRQLSQGLIPVEVGPEGLPSALDDLARRTAAVTGVSCTLDSSRRVRIHDDAVATHLYRIAQEAVANALRHGRAKKIDIALTRRGNSGSLRVQDNGVGLSDGGGTGLGLKIMRHRAELIGGKLTVRRSRGGGVTVVCAFPIH